MTTSAPVTLPWPRIGIATNFVKAFISAASVSSAARVHVLAAGHRQAHAEEEARRTCRLHPVDEVLQLLAASGRFRRLRVVHRLALDQRPQDRDAARSPCPAGPAGRCRRPSRSCVSRMSTSTIVRSLRPRGQELALLHERVLGEVPRMALGRVAAPVDDEVGPVLDFAQRARNFATQLGGDLGWTVSKRGVAVDHAADQLGQRDRIPAGPRR